MKKLSWFKRIFMSWDQLFQYINPNPTTMDEIKKIYDERINDFKNMIESNNKSIEELKVEKSELVERVRSLTQNDEQNKKVLLEKQNIITNLQDSINVTRTKLESKQSEYENIKMNINEKLATLTKIESTFFAKSGNKGKGELGELQVKTILEKSGLTKDMWVENLQVGSKNVEFAIKSGNDGKWIPVDSKVLDTEQDEKGNIIVDTNYKNRVFKQAKEVAVYLAKDNTAGYGLLVLQSDSIYIELHKQFPGIFEEILRETKIHISSPSLFIQTAWSISQIVDIYERVKNGEQIFGEMISTLNTVADFAKAIKESHAKLNIAINKWLPSIENKHANLSKKLEKSGKIKMIDKEK